MSRAPALQRLVKRKCVIYIRISDPKQKRKGDGIRSQESACRDYARYHNMEVVGVFVDVMSGKFATRPKMAEMLEFLYANRHENYAVIIDDISRLARNYIAHMNLRDEIREAGGELFSPTMEFFDDPKRQMPEKITALVKEQERIDNADRTLSRQIARTKNGYYTFPAPTGYKYVKDKPGRGGKVLVREEPVASVVREALEKFANGILGSQTEVKRFLEDHPQFPKTKSGKIGKSRVKTMLTQPIYAGYLEYEPWGIPLMKAQHEPLISFATYLKVQDRLNGTLHQFPVRLDINPEFPLRGLVDCAECGTLLRAGRSKGRTKYYHYYACHTKDCSSYGKSIKKDKIEGEFEALLEKLSPAPELLEIANIMFKAVWDKHMAAFKERQKAAKHTLAGIEKRIDNLVERIVSATQPKLIAAYEGELVKLDNQRLATTEQIERLNGENGKDIPDFNKAYRTAMAFLSNPCLLWRNSHISHKRAVVKLAFSGQLSYDRNEGYRTAETSLPFQIIQRLSGNQKEKNMLNERMVGDTGIEPVTPTMSILEPSMQGRGDISIRGTAGKRKIAISGANNSLTRKRLLECMPLTLYAITVWVL